MDDASLSDFLDADGTSDEGETAIDEDGGSAVDEDGEPMADEGGEARATDEDPDGTADEDKESVTDDGGTTASEGVASQGVDPAVSTMASTPMGAACADCGETVVRRWVDEDALVCRACKEW